MPANTIFLCQKSEQFKIIDDFFDFFYKKINILKLKWNIALKNNRNDKIRILVIDDSESWRNIVKDVIETMPDKKYLCEGFIVSKKSNFFDTMNILKKLYIKIYKWLHIYICLRGKKYKYICDTVSFSDYKDTLQKIKENQYNIVFLSNSGNRFSLLKILKMLKKDYPDLPVIMISSTPFVQNIQKRYSNIRKTIYKGRESENSDFIIDIKEILINIVHIKEQKND